MPGLFHSQRHIAVSKVASFTATDNYTTSMGTGPQANPTAFSAWVMVDPMRNNNTNNYQVLFGKTGPTYDSATKGGWVFASFQNTIIFDVDITGITETFTQRLAQGAATGALELGQIQVFHATIIIGIVTLYKNGVPTGIGSTDGPGLHFPGPVNFPSGAGICFGAYPNSLGSPFEGGIIAAGICSLTGLSESQVLAHYAALLLDPYATPSGATSAWKATDAGATWVDFIGGLSATKNGSPVKSDVLMPFYPSYDPGEFFGEIAPLYSEMPNTAGNMKIMCVGDSHIYGPQSFRQFIEMNKVDGGLSNITYVGGVSPSNEPIIPGYPTHLCEGYGGANAESILSGHPPEPLIPLYDPDIIVLWMGINGNDTVASRAAYQAWIERAYAVNPDIRFLAMGELNYIRNGGVNGPDKDANTKAFTNWVSKTLVTEMRKKGIKISCVKIDLTIPWDSDDDWFHGGSHAIEVHPEYARTVPWTENVGYNKVGRPVWYAVKILTGRYLTAAEKIDLLSVSQRQN